MQWTLCRACLSHLAWSSIQYMYQLGNCWTGSKSTGRCVGVLWQNKCRERDKYTGKWRLTTFCTGTEIYNWLPNMLPSVGVILVDVLCLVCSLSMRPSLEPSPSTQIFFTAVTMWFFSQLQKENCVEGLHETLTANKKVVPLAPTLMYSIKSIINTRLLSII